MVYFKHVLMILTYSTIFPNLRTNKLYLYAEIKPWNCILN